MPWFQRSIGETRDTPVAAKQVRLLCPHCSASVYVDVPVGCTSLTRQERIKEGVDEHRRLCPSVESVNEVVYRIDYPRG
jgi:hypothetical protein